MEGGELAVMVAATSDPEFKTRLAALREAMAAADERQAELQKIGEDNAEVLRQAREEHAAAEATLAEVAQLRQQHDEDTAGLASANQAMTEEKERFEAVRRHVEEQHAAKDAELTARETALVEREAAVEAAHIDQADREQKLMRGEQQMAVAMEHAQKLVEVFHGPLA